MTVRRITLVQELLEFIGLGGRVHLAWISSAEAHRFVQVVAAFTDHIRGLGPNPLKAYHLTTTGATGYRPTARIREPLSRPVAVAALP